MLLTARSVHGRQTLNVNISVHGRLTLNVNISVHGRQTLNVNISEFETERSQNTPVSQSHKNFWKQFQFHLMIDPWALERRVWEGGGEGVR